MAEPDLAADSLAVFLARTELFEGFAPTELVALVPHFDVQQVAEGHRVFEEGSAGEAFYLVLDGEVAVRRSVRGRPDHDLDHLGPGDCFGEMALIDGAPRMASVDALTDALLLVLERRTFVDLLRAGEPVATRLLWAMSRVLCRRQRELTVVLEDLVEGVNEPQRGLDAEAIDALYRRHVTWN